MYECGSKTYVGKGAKPVTLSPVLASHLVENGLFSDTVAWHGQPGIIKFTFSVELLCLCHVGAITLALLHE